MREKARILRHFYVRISTFKKINRNKSDFEKSVWVRGTLVEKKSLEQGFFFENYYAWK